LVGDWHVRLVGNLGLVRHKRLVWSLWLVGNLGNQRLVGDVRLVRDIRLVWSHRRLRLVRD
jgi:hypothetical protein